MHSQECRPAAGLLGAQQRRGGEGEGEVRRGEVVAAVQPRGRRGQVGGARPAHQHRAPAEHHAWWTGVLAFLKPW